MNSVPGAVLEYFFGESAKDIEISALGDKGNVCLLKKGEDKYVLKWYEGDTKSSAQLNQEVISFLQDTGYDAAFRPLSELSTAGARSECFSLEDSSWFLREYVPADSEYDWLDCDLEPDYCREAGRLLGKLHRATELSDRGRERTECEQRFPLVFENKPEASLEAIEEDMPVALEILVNYAGEKGLEDFTGMARGSPYFPDAVYRSFDGMAGVLHNLDPDESTRLLHYLEEATVLNHGDYHPGNVIFQNGKAQAMIDLDYAYFGPPINDIAYGFFMFVSGRKADGIYQEDEDIRYKAKAYLQGYFSETVGDVPLKAVAPMLYELLVFEMYRASCLTLIWLVDSLVPLGEDGEPSEARPKLSEEVAKKHYNAALYCISSMRMLVGGGGS